MRPNSPASSPASIDLRVTQPIYRGGRTEAQTRQAINTVQATRAQTLAVETDGVSGGRPAYLDVVRDQTLVEVTRNNEQVLRRQLEATQRPVSGRRGDPDRCRAGRIVARPGHRPAHHCRGQAGDQPRQLYAGRRSSAGPAGHAARAAGLAGHPRRGAGARRQQQPERHRRDRLPSWRPATMSISCAASCCRRFRSVGDLNRSYRPVGHRSRHSHRIPPRSSLQLTMPLYEGRRDLFADPRRPSRPSASGAARSTMPGGWRCSRRPRPGRRCSRRGPRSPRSAPRCGPPRSRSKGPSRRRWSDRARCSTC